MNSEEVNNIHTPVITGLLNFQDLVLELPLPTPLPDVGGQESLTIHVRCKAERIEEIILIPQLIDALSNTKTNNIVLKNVCYAGKSSTGQMSQLARSLICYPELFQESILEPRNKNRDNSAYPYPSVDRKYKTSDHFQQYLCNINLSPHSLLKNCPNVHLVAVSDQQHSTSPLYSIYMSPKSDYLKSPDLQKMSHIINSSADNCNVDVPFQSLIGQTYRNINCIDEVNTTAISIEQNNIDNQCLNVAQGICSVDTNCSSIMHILNRPDDQFMSPCPSSSLLSAYSFRTEKEPIVVLSKLSLEDQILAQKSVHQFTMKRKKAVSPEPPIVFSTHSGLDFKKRRICSDSDNIASSQSQKYLICIESSDSEIELNPEYSSPEETFVASNVEKLSKEQAIKDLVAESLSTEALVDSSAFQHFSVIVDDILDLVEDIDFSVAIDEDSEYPSEALIPLIQLQELSTEAAKLKNLQAMNLFPSERLVHLLKILEINILDGAKLSIKMIKEHEGRKSLLLDPIIQRILRSAHASLTTLYIMTSPQMPINIFYEDVIEKIILLLKYQLQNTIFPVFDTAYRLDPQTKYDYIGSTKHKKAYAHKVKEKCILQLYNKFHEAIGLLTDLLEKQTVTDSIILQVSTLGICPFFVEGIGELQLNALRLVTAVFSLYEEHRYIILDDVLSSLAKLPISKRSLKCFHLNSEQSIQMLTALVLQLIQSVIRLPEPEINLQTEFQLSSETSKNVEDKEKICSDKDILIITSYEASIKTAIIFLSVFFKKLGKKNEKIDYRPLFENFVQDLLNTVSKPDWPASELLLSLLGNMLIRNFTEKTNEISVRVASLDYLGVIAAHLRKDAIASQVRKDVMQGIIQRILKDKDDVSSSAEGKSKKQDEIQILQEALLHYLDMSASDDPALQFSRKFYIAQWYRDAVIEVKRSAGVILSEKSINIDLNNKETLSRSRSFHHNENIEKNSKIESGVVNTKALKLADKKKQFLLTVLKQKTSKVVTEKNHIDYETAKLVSKYLSSNRYFSQIFDTYLSHILCVLSEPVVAIRTKAIKCLSLVIEVDPCILARSDIQKAVHGRMHDQSISVREATVDLLGKYILIRPQLLNEYYEMLTERILDTGVSVRKRVIKILKDICIEQPDFPQIPDICVKILRRVNDEDGIRKLVNEVFQTMWFSQTSYKKKGPILQKVKNIVHVVEACRDTGLEWFEQLLLNLLKNKDDGNYKYVVKSCKQIVDNLVANLLLIEESFQNVDDMASLNAIACLETLYLFSKIHPHFVVPHANIIQPYLSMRCNTKYDLCILKSVVKILELAVPLIEHPSESFLAQIEENIMKLILCQHMGLLSTCVSCLCCLVNKVTRNYQLVKDCFEKFFIVLLMCKKSHEKIPENENLKDLRTKLLRSLYTVGLFCRYFDFDTVYADIERNDQFSYKDKIFRSLIYFNQQYHDDEELGLKALTGIGFFMIRHHEFMLGLEIKSLYHDLLTTRDVSPVLKRQVLRNIANYLVEEDMIMLRKDAEWNKTSKFENLKDIGDVKSGMASTIIQVYLNQILDCVLHAQIFVRRTCFCVIQLIIEQGLVNPVLFVPYLICLGSEDDPVIEAKSNNLLQEIEKKYPGFILAKAMIGVRMSFDLQKLIQNQNEILRGFRSSEDPVSRLGALYCVLKSTRHSRRAFLMSLTKLFDEQASTPLPELLYIADNIAYFPYTTQDEPLFIIHHLELMISVCGYNLLQVFYRAFKDAQPFDESENSSTPRSAEDCDDVGGDNFEAVLKCLPKDTKILQESVISAQSYILLLYIKQTLKEMYNFTDVKVQQYSPSEIAKVYERPLNRKVHVEFNPETVLSFLKSLEFEGDLDDQDKEKLVKEYLHFKQMMMMIDLPDNESKMNQAKSDLTSLVVSPSKNTAENTVVDEISYGTETDHLASENVLYPKYKALTHNQSNGKSPKPTKRVVKKKITGC